jgi:hypothetical protein
VTNLGLNLTVAYACAGFDEAVNSASISNSLLLIYDLTPSPYTSNFLPKRVRFPEHNAAQYLASAPDRFMANGSIDTDFAPQMLKKLINKEMCENNPELCFVVKAATLKLDQITDLIQTARFRAARGLWRGI